MSFHNKNDLLIPKHIIPDNVSFSIFTSAEVKKMCVQKVVSPFILDPLGHPLPGGLYDKNLGPLSERSEPCGTCNKNIYYCSGHFAYIELPLPVVNPVFHKIIGTVLKISCLACYKIQLNKDPREKLSSLGEDEIIELGIMKMVLNEVKPANACIFCRSHIDKIQVLKNRIILVTRKSDNQAPNTPSVMARKVKSVESQYITPSKSKDCLREIWKNEEDLLRLMVPVLCEVKAKFPTDALFFEVIPVPPPNVRPVNIVNDRMVEHPQTQAYKSIVMNVNLLRTIIIVVQNKGDENCLSSVEAKQAYSAARGSKPTEKLNNCWEDIQSDVNGLLDKDSVRIREGLGLKQLIEKKAGIIRMHMMGKRVNFAARSVITPDPNLNIDEIGIPEAFAKKLTYPVPVTTWNVEEMRKLIMNGPNVHPGAVLVELEDGTVKRINPAQPVQQESLLKILLTPHDKGRRGFQGVKIVHRHLMNGDVLLLNRQPTLHKPSIMAHTARILKGEKTLRLHYANCKAYNADFDGDEMNAHFPQSELARSEGYNIANVSNQYLVPKDGTPLSGLIQDHMIAGVRLSIRGRFFDKYDYQQLVFQALSYKTGRIQLLPPAIIKPARLWSGKQILSTVIINIIPAGREPIHLTATSKIPAKAWQTARERRWKAGGTPFKNPNTMTEAEVVIRGGELLVGILDKTHYGATPYGLVHCIYELYGGTYAIRLLSSFAKLFTRFLQQEGFTLGVHDILTVPSADRKRREIIKESRKIGKQVITTALNLPETTELNEIVEKIEELSATDPKIRQIIDRQYKTSLDSYTNAINKACLPAGLVCKFPRNNLQLMVQSGAKGSTVNTMQISCLLGQIELEGKRPPVMISGKSLPSFPASEFTPRAGGFIDGRFMTGIQPQEFFFHCMAGREGLIDTAVKTSRSGYLQRCLIKHLEGLHVGYDMTVRNSDQKVIQFLYGEDGMDISKAQFLNKKQLPFLAENRKALIRKEVVDELKNDEEHEQLENYQKKISEWREKFGDPLKQERKSVFSSFTAYTNSKLSGKKISKENHIKLWHECDEDTKNEFMQNYCEPCPDPVTSIYQPDHHFGSLNECMENLMENHVKDKKKKYKREFQNMWKLKNMMSLCAPGEPVGLLAAQSIGEPSTQMTLNTFHFAGRGEMNVTLGIPRLREILMMASKRIKTPSMEIPFLYDVPNLEVRADRLRKKLTRVVVADVLETVDVTATLELIPVRQHKYTLKFQFLPRECYEDDYIVTPRQIMKHVKNTFFKEMFISISKHSRVKSNLVSMEEESTRRRPRANEDDDDEGEPEDRAKRTSALGRQEEEEDSSDEDVEDEEDAKQTNKFQQVHEDQEPEEEEREASDDDADLENKSEEPTDDNDEQANQEVTDRYNFAEVYKQDQKKHLWCELTFVLPLSYKKLDLTAILKEVAAKSVIWETPNIKRAITYMKDDRLTLRTDGINIVEMFQYNTLLDLEKLYCNDIHKVAETYGIEAASRIIVKEVKDVFNVYGIKVDPRHLSLIADYMTFNGSFEPLSRRGMENSSSPLQQMAFEASLNFLKEATTKGKRDDLQNPSSCLMVGKPCNTGTGCFTLLEKIPAAITTTA